MYIYLIIILGLSLIAAIAKTTGWRPKSDPNWRHAIDVILLVIALAWIVHTMA